MPTARLEAFTDGVLAIVITILVLELGVPPGTHLQDLAPLVPVLLAYLLSFLVIGIYWSNHHHLMQVAERVDGRVLWSNLALLFWLSLLPFAIRWLDETDFASGPAAGWGIVLTMASASWIATVRSLVALEGDGSPLRTALSRDRKAWVSLGAYAASTSLAFVAPWLAIAGYALTTGAWLFPDRRLERIIKAR